MITKTKLRRKIISVTISTDYVIWLKQVAAQNKIPKSRLVEKGIKLLKEHVQEEKEKMLEKEINIGIETMIKMKEDQKKIAESDFSPRVGKELL